MSVVSSTEASAVEPEQKFQRPTPLHWLGYAFGAGLPECNRTWVLHDTTCPSWAWRHGIRLLVQLALPIVAVCLFVPGPAWIRIAIVVAGTFMSMVFSFGYATETTEHRLVKAGYPAGLGEQTRSEHAVTAQREANAVRRAKREARRTRRAARRR